MDEIISQTHGRINELLRLDARPANALARFSDDRAVRIMTIHKSKGLEFNTVIMLGVEDQTYWGDPAEQRSAFFVGISRARSQLLLTTADQRARPQGFNGNWRVQRTPHGEFLGYAKAVL